MNNARLHALLLYLLEQYPSDQHLLYSLLDCILEFYVGRQFTEFKTLVMYIISVIS